MTRRNANIDIDYTIKKAELKVKRGEIMNENGRGSSNYGLK